MLTQPNLTDPADAMLFCSVLAVALTETQARLGLDQDGSLTVGTMVHRLRQARRVLQPMAGMLGGKTPEVVAAMVRLEGRLIALEPLAMEAARLALDD